MSFKTHYDNLKVSRTATKKEIKKSYRKLCSKHHPDKYPEQEREKQNKILVIINKAYSILSDDILRKQHDEWIRQQEQNPHAQRNHFNEQEQQRREEQRKAWEEEQAKKKAWRDIQESIKREKEKAEALRKEQELQAAKEAAIRKAKACKEDKDRKRIDSILAIIGFVIIAGILFKINADEQAKPPTTVSTQVRHPSSIQIFKITREIIDDKLITDIYFDNHRDDVTLEQLKDLVKGSLSNKKDCLVREEYQHRVKYQYIFHFRKGGKRIYSTISLKHLCNKD